MPLTDRKLHDLRCGGNADRLRDRHSRLHPGQGAAEGAAAHRPGDPRGLCRGRGPAASRDAPPALPVDDGAHVPRDGGEAGASRRAGRCRGLPPVDSALAGLPGLNCGAEAAAPALPAGGHDQFRQLGPVELRPHAGASLRRHGDGRDGGLEQARSAGLRLHPRAPEHGRLRLRRYPACRPEPVPRHRGRQAAGLSHLLDRAAEGQGRCRGHAEDGGGGDPRLPLRLAGGTRPMRADAATVRQPFVRVLSPAATSRWRRPWPCPSGPRTSPSAPPSPCPCP